MIRRIQFALLVMVIVAVGAYDVYLSIKHQNTLFEMEENPIGRWLIALDGGDVALFMTLKMIGISLVVWALMAMFRYRRHLAMPVATVLATFQAWLFYYLTFA